LQTLIRPAHAATMIADLIRQTQQSPYGPPVWPLQGVETGCMIGWHAVPVLAEAMAKGIPADYAAAWPGIRRRALDFTTPTQDNSLGIPFYDQLGYVPADLLFESVSRTLEYSYDDYAAARIARAAGAVQDAAHLESAAATGATCSMPAWALPARAWPTAPGPAPTTRCNWATRPSGATIPKAMAGRPRSSTSTTCPA
jgi:putative alpha-1,2-mannosidase